MWRELVTYGAFYGYVSTTCLVLSCIDANIMLLDNNIATVIHAFRRIR